MAITNVEIITTECLLHNITEPVNTYDGWRRAGKQVQKGQKALFVTQIWKPCKCKPKTPEAEPFTKLIMVKAGFFGLSQVADIEVKIKVKN